jgi:hypothetical protein
VLERAAPSLVTLVEYDAAWRALGPPPLPPPTASVATAAPLPAKRRCSGRRGGGRWHCARQLRPPCGVGQATVQWDPRLLEPCADRALLARLGLLPADGAIRSERSRGLGGGSDQAPKSSCMLLLQPPSPAAAAAATSPAPAPRAPPWVVLAVSVHFESGPPSLTHKVAKRRAQLRSTLSHVSDVAARLREVRVIEVLCSTLASDRQQC